jgi:hypothetical protein
MKLNARHTSILKDVIFREFKCDSIMHILHLEKYWFNLRDFFSRMMILERKKESGE